MSPSIRTSTSSTNRRRTIASSRSLAVPDSVTPASAGWSVHRTPRAPPWTVHAFVASSGSVARSARLVPSCNDGGRPSACSSTSLSSHSLIPSAASSADSSYPTSRAIAASARCTVASCNRRRIHQEAGFGPRNVHTSVSSPTVPTAASRARGLSASHWTAPGPSSGWPAVPNGPRIQAAVRTIGDHLRGPTVTAPDMAHQLQQRPTGTRRNRCRPVRVPQQLAQQVVLFDQRSSVIHDTAFRVRRAAQVVRAHHEPSLGRSRSIAQVPSHLGASAVSPPVRRLRRQTTDAVIDDAAVGRIFREESGRSLAAVIAARSVCRVEGEPPVKVDHVLIDESAGVAGAGVGGSEAPASPRLGGERDSAAAAR